MKKVLYSIHPKWVYKILIGTKLIEVRKTVPKVELPFEGYIYCTKDNSLVISLGPFGPAMLDFEDEYVMNGKIVAKFTCNRIHTYPYNKHTEKYLIDEDELALTCLQHEDLVAYGKGKPLYGIYIDNVEIFEQPLPVSCARVACHYFEKYNDTLECDSCPYLVVDQAYEYEEDYCGVDGVKPLIRPPQSWGYIRGIQCE